MLPRADRSVLTVSSAPGTISAHPWRVWQPAAEDVNSVKLGGVEVRPGYRGKPETCLSRGTWLIGFCSFVSRIAMRLSCANRKTRRRLWRSYSSGSKMASRILRSLGFWSEMLSRIPKSLGLSQTLRGIEKRYQNKGLGSRNFRTIQITFISRISDLDSKYRNYSRRRHIRMVSRVSLPYPLFHR